MQHADPQAILEGCKRGIDLVKSKFPLQSIYPTRLAYYEEIERYATVFSYYSTAAQVVHRYHLENPVFYMKEAITLAEQLGHLWADGNKIIDPEDIDQKGFWKRFPQRLDVVMFRFGMAAIYSLLIYDEMSPEILQVVPSVSSWRPNNYFDNEYLADSGLVYMLQNGRRPKKWHALLDNIEAEHKTNIFTETMESYAEIILNWYRDDLEKAFQNVKISQELFLRRGRYDYNVFTSEEGVYAGNALSIDLRLSALMRYCFRECPEMLDPLESIHRWPE